MVLYPDFIAGKRETMQVKKKLARATINTIGE
jgi:hypothetical protein